MCRKMGSSHAGQLSAVDIFEVWRSPADIHQGPPVSAKSKSDTGGHEVVHGGLRFCLAECRPNSVRRGHKIVRVDLADVRRTVRHIMSDTDNLVSASVRCGQNRSPPMSAADNCVSASVRGGLRLGGRRRMSAGVRRTLNLSAASNSPPWELPEDVSDYRQSYEGTR